MSDPEIMVGSVAPKLREEFPGLAVLTLSVAARPGRSPQDIKNRMGVMSSRFTGAKAIGLRLEPVPAAYRVFFRHIGIDPDERRTPAEQLALQRMHDGAYRSRGLPADALTIATAETGVPVLVLDHERVHGRLGFRLSEQDERLGGDERTLAGQQIVIADEQCALAVLFGDQAEGASVRRRTSRMLLAAVRVEGVPAISAEEALWTAAEVLGGPGLL